LTAVWEREEAAAWRPPPRLSVSTWADEHMHLDPVINPAGGRFNSARTPYVREWLDSFVCRWVRQVTIVAATQVGKTTSLNNVLAYAVAQDPCPIMVVVPRTSDVPTFYERRLMPLVLSSPVLRDELTDRARDVKRREILFRRAIVYLRSSESPADLASVPVRCLFADEVDKYPGWSGREASPLDLARERQKNVWNAARYITSTPTDRGSAVMAEFRDGDQRRYWVPCPHCGAFQLLRWEQIKFDSSLDAREIRRRRDVRYECDACAQPIADSEKRGMLERGIWCPDGTSLEAWRAGGAAEDRADHRSYHLWAAYSPWLSWWQLAAEFMRCKGTPERLQNWVNSWLAEPWEERTASTSSAEVASRIGTHKLGDVPDGVRVLTAAVDVQKDYMAWAVWGWGMDEENWLVACGESPTFGELGDILFRNTWGAKQLAIRLCVVDTRHRSDDVFDFYRAWPTVVRMIMGVERDAPVPFGTLRLQKHPRTGAPMPDGPTIWTVNVGQFKDLVAQRLKPRPAEVGDGPRSGVLHLAQDTPEDFLTQLVAEHKIRERSGKKTADRWVLRPGHDRNEAWDLAVYNTAAARMIRVDTLRTRPPGAPARGRQAPAPRGARAPAQRLKTDHLGFPVLE
jgi:phage terminase large subunit GpA-like protein